MTLGELLKGKGFHMSKGMSAVALIAMWKALPPAIQKQFPAIAAAILVLEGSLVTLAAARKLYEDANTAVVTATNTALAVTNPAIGGLQQTKTEKKSATDTQTDLINKGKKSITDAIMNTVVPGTAGV